MILQSLNGNWNMTRKGDSEVLEATVPGTMYLNLLMNNKINDPFVGENDVLQTDLSKDSYSFSRLFAVSEDLLKEEKVFLNFYGLDTLATIYLNNIKIGQTNNMHRTYVFEVKKHLKKDNNTITVDFYSPLKFIEEKQKKNPLWGIDTTIPGYAYIRKAHCMFGWDWGPQLPDMGIWRDVTLAGYSYGKIDDVYIRQLHNNGDVTLLIDLNVIKWCDFDGTLKISVMDTEGKIVASEICNANTKEVSLKILEPKLWWPNGYGDQPLYRVTINLLKDDIQLDDWSRRIGLRKFTVRREKDQWGESFEFNINGISIFAMGANYIPEDALITRPDRDRTKKLIKDCVKANYNCIRVWGGGVYPNDEFYDLCDEYGLIVWQDFMFACGVYRLTKEFEENIKQEFIDNIKRIRHHASLGLWCGNNEMEWAFVEWDLPKDERLRMDYLLMYEKLIPDILEKYDPQTFYWPASPSSGGGFDKPNDDNKGDVHYWNVFHGNEHYKAFRKHYFRFASEYGMQSFPDMKTIEYFAKEHERKIFGPVMENHNKCISPYNGNLKIMLNVACEFPVPKSIEQIAYVSQVFQGETIKCGVEHWRRNRGRCMGSTYWQVNDNYPVASWSSIDYFGRWKALHYYAKRFYSSVLLSGYEDGFKGHIYITNDKLTDFHGQVKIQLRHQDKGILVDSSYDVKIPALTPMHITTIDADKYVQSYGEDRKIYLAYQLYDAEGKYISDSTLLFTYHKYFDFRKPTYNISLTKTGEKITITIASNTYVKALGLSIKDFDVVFNDNYFDLLPNVPKSVTIDDGPIEELLKDENLKDKIIIESVNTLD